MIPHATTHRSKDSDSYSERLIAVVVVAVGGGGFFTLLAGSGMRRKTS